MASNKGSRPEVGSSRISNSTSEDRAATIATFCRLLVATVWSASNSAVGRLDDSERHQDGAPDDAGRRGYALGGDIEDRLERGIAVGIYGV